MMNEKCVDVDKLYKDVALNHSQEDQFARGVNYRAIERIEAELHRAIQYSEYQSQLINTHNNRFRRSILFKLLSILGKNVKIKGKTKDEFFAINKLTPFIIDMRSGFGLTNQIDAVLPKTASVKLTKNPTYVDFSIKGLSVFKLETKVSLCGEETDFEKLALVRVMFFDRFGSLVEGNPARLGVSKVVGPYKYFNYKDGSFHFEIDLPPDVYYLRLGMQVWDAKNALYLQNYLSTNMATINNFDSEYQVREESDNSFPPGISIITASYKGIGTLPEMIESVLAQTLDREFIQLIVVVNGIDDGSIEYLKNVQELNNNLDICIEFLEAPGASHARNRALQIAEREYCVILDDDDIIQPEYLESMYRYAAPNTLVVSGIYDFKKRGKYIKDNAICEQVRLSSNKDNPVYLDVNGAMTMSACKLVPTSLMKQVSFKENLKSGEDVVFFTDLIGRFEFDVKVIEPNDENVYLRRLKEDSVSRRSDSFEFLVKERLLVISALIDVLNNNAKCPDYIIGKIHAQTNFIKKYLNKFPNDKERVSEAVKYSQVGEYVFPVLNKNKAKGVVYSYCFPPYVDTAGVITAKRIYERGEIVDVVYNKMSSIRKESSELGLICDDFIESRFELSTPTSFGDWRAIESYALDSYSVAGSKKEYEFMYSRALWPASHFAAFVHKMNKPKTPWVAEFSDPSLWDINAEMRQARVIDGPLKELIKKSLLKYKIRLAKKEWNMYFLCELLPYVFADELIFTCENQKKVMFSKFPMKNIAKSAEKKSLVSAHPTLPSKFYNYAKSDYVLDDDKINIAYFGAFYESRGLDELFDAILMLSDKEREYFRVHVFTGDQNNLSARLQDSELADVVVVNGYLDYLTFLNSLKSFSYLFVNDAKATKFFGLNPYLPSKYSDYKGSGVKVLGLCEPGSELDGMKLSGGKFNNAEQLASYLQAEVIN